MRKLINNNIFRSLLICMALFIIVLLTEWIGFHAKLLLLPTEEKGIVELQAEKIVTPEQRDVNAPNNSTVYLIQVDQSYTNKLAVYMKGNSSFANYKIRYKITGNGSFSNEYASFCNLATGRDHIKIGKNVEQIIVETTDGVQLEKVELNNTIQLNSKRIIWMYCIALCVYLLYKFREKIGNKIEVGFLIVGVTVGVAWTIALPVNTSLTWDDQIHFDNAYKLSCASNEVTVTQAEQELASLRWAVIKSGSYYHVLDTYEDEQDLIKLLDGKDKLQGQTTYYTGGLPNIGYVTQSLGLGIGKVLGLPFHLQFLMGRLANILTYIGICYLAISKAVRYKAIICAIAFLPTAFQIACSYSYDPMVNACLLLGCSLFISEMLTPKVKLRWGSAVLMLAAFCIGSFPKAVYIPIILLLLLLPKSKFTDKKSMLCFRIGVIAIFVILMSSFVVPALLSTGGGGDSRGGEDVNLAQQLSFVLHNPITYSKLLIKSTLLRSYSFLINDTRFFFPYMDPFVSSSFLASLLPALNLVSLLGFMYVLFTDCRKKTDTEELKDSTRCWILLAIVVVVALIWTSMYLIFTPVRSGTINGVQGRYFIPLIFLGAVLLNPRKVESKTDPMKYNLMVLGCNALVLFSIVGVYLIGSVWL